MPRPHLTGRGIYAFLPIGKTVREAVVLVLD